MKIDGKETKNLQNGLEGRVCNCCKIYKTKEHFSPHKRSKGGLYSNCHACCKIKRKKYYDKNKQKLLARQKEKRSTKQYKRKANIRQNKYRRKNPTKMLYLWVKNKCIKNNIEFNLTENDIIYNEICPVLGIKMEIGGNNLNNSPTLDRINPHKGYIKGNVVVISHLANRIKNQATIKDIENILKYMKKYEVLFKE